MNRAILFTLFSFFLFSHTAYTQEVHITHGPYIQALDENEVTIVWTTDSKAVSWVEVAPAGDDSFYASERPRYYQTSNGNRVVGILHKIKIQGLKKGTEYRYRVFSKAVLSYEGHRVLYGNIASSNVYSRKPLRFSTLDKDKESVSFVMLNDIHSRIDDLKNLLENVTYGKTDLVFFNGDMVSSMNDETQFFNGFMDEAVSMFAGEVPVYYCRGNHETRGKFSVKFPEYYPTNNEKLYYSFRQGPVYFIVLDGGEDKPDSDIEYSGLAQFDAYRSEQKQWLKELIETEDFKNAKYKMVLIHIPPAGSTWHGPNDIRNKFLPVLNGQSITAMLCGHLHRYEYLKPEAGLYDFPIIINAHNTALEVQADENSLSIFRKNTDGETLEKLTF